jgi:hypothetical protein
MKAVLSEQKRIVSRLADSGRLAGKWDVAPKHYSLISNACMAPGLRGKITSAIRSVLPESDIHLHDGRDVCNWINITPEIVPRFPQIFTISDLRLFLGEIVNRDIINRSSTAIAMASEDSRVFVPTRAYYEAQEKLVKYFFVVLEGPPEMGKTTIARMAAMAQMKRGWEAIECKGPKEFQKAYRSDCSQVFVADDFFGRTEYEPARISRWQEELPYILRQLNCNHWLILTSRAHLVKMAKHDLDVPSQNHVFPKLGEVLVNAGKLTALEKARILYRHAKAAKLSQTIRDQLKIGAKSIVEHDQFTPLRIKNLVTSLNSEVYS